MKKILFATLMIFLLLVTGCSLLYKEIDTNQKDCKEMMISLGGAMLGDIVDMECKNQCQVEGYVFVRWKCSDIDTLVCICKYSY